LTTSKHLRKKDIIKITMGRVVKQKEYEGHFSGRQNNQIAQNNGEHDFPSGQTSQISPNTVVDSTRSFDEVWGNFSLAGRGLNISDQSYDQVWGNFSLADDSSFSNTSQNDSFRR